MTWYDVKLYQFEKLQELIKIEEEEERLIAIAELLLGDEVTDLAISEFNEAVKELSFLSEECPNKVPPKKLEVNGRKYFVDCLLGKITATQYVDFTNHLKNGANVATTLSVFIIPEGHKYNDGYDILEVVEDIKCIPIPIINSISFFFKRQFNKSITIFQSYLAKLMKNSKVIPTEIKEATLKLIQQSMDLVSSPIYLNSVK